MQTTPRDAWDVSEQSFPGTAPVELQLRFLVRYAILAPSVKNSQPWIFEVEGHTVRLFADPGRGLPVTDPDSRELEISVGCALENLLVAAEHFGFRHEVTYFPAGDWATLVASVLFAPGGTRSPARAGITLDAILHRHNDNGAFRPETVPAELRQALQDCRLEPDLQLELVDDGFFRRWLEELTAEADRREFADPAFRQELGDCIGEGAFGTSRLVSRLARALVSRADLGEPAAEQDRRIIRSTSLVGVVRARNDSRLTHVRTGQLFERLWLAATAMGVNLHPMSQTMRIPALREAIAGLLPEDGWIPQHLFRVGYSARETELRHTPRRALEEVLR